LIFQNFPKAIFTKKKRVTVT